MGLIITITMTITTSLVPKYEKQNSEKTKQVPYSFQQQQQQKYFDFDFVFSFQNLEMCVPWDLNVHMHFCASLLCISLVTMSAVKSRKHVKLNKYEKIRLVICTYPEFVSISLYIWGLYIYKKRKEICWVHNFLRIFFRTFRIC